MLEHAFVIWGSPITWLEVIAFVLALACVVCNVLEIHWGWPLAIVSSAMYVWLFGTNRLYGDAGVQVFFVLASIWGWWQWLFGRRADQQPLRVARLRGRSFLLVCVAWLLLWPALGALLAALTDSDVPWFDAFPTVGSVLGQILLGRKFVENWWVWQAVNLSSVALFAYKGLYLTMLLYAIFLVMAIVGLRRWQALIPRSAAPSA